MDTQELLRSHWGLNGEAVPLGSLQDRVFAIARAGAGGAILKVSSAGDDAAVVEDAALVHFASRSNSLALPHPIPTVDGRTEVSLDEGTARLMERVPGVSLGGIRHLPRRALVALGRACGETACALEGFDHPLLGRSSVWDPRRAIVTGEGCLADLRGETRTAIRAALERLRSDPLFASDPTGSRSADLPMQAVHCDVTDLNVFGRPGDGDSVRITGLIDFGDLTWSWRMTEPAVTVHSAIGRDPQDPLGAALAVLEGYLQRAELTEEEADHLWEAVLARAAVCAALEAVESAGRPENDYATRLASLDLRALEAVLEVDAALARAVIREAAGFAPGGVDLRALVRAADPAPLFGGAHVADLPLECGYGEVVLFDDERADPANPETLQLGLELQSPAGIDCFAPLGGVVVEREGRAIVVECRLDTGAGDPVALFLRIDGIRSALGAGAAVDRGQRIGRLEAVPRGAGRTPTSQILFGALRSGNLCGRLRDRGALLALHLNPVDPGAPAGQEQRGRTPAGPRPTVHERRVAHVAAAQGLYFERPFEAVAGRGQWLFDESGRRYLDMVNNVAVVGHSHPRIARAVARQLECVNTNSRFLYGVMGEYAEAIAEKLPEGLGSLFFVNSGSEAVDLALQLARVYTRRNDFVGIEASYHGWTSEVFELCTMPLDRPDWRQTLKPYVHVMEVPYTCGGPEVDFAAPLERALGDAARSGGLAAFISEPMLASQGGMELPHGYLASVYAAARAAGGVCIADEIQVGYGRTGDHFWAHEGQGAAPDILVAAKAVGNGFPVGFVACRPEIAEAFERRASFFSSTGGSPVSCAVGLEVLRILQDEGLQANAMDVGGHLKRGLEAIAEECPEIAAVHGRGLYLGVELADHRTGEPAPELASSVCERMRELGIVVRPTGISMSVLKVKPPLCIRHEDARRFARSLKQALEELRDLHRTRSSC